MVLACVMFCFSTLLEAVTTLVSEIPERLNDFIKVYDIALKQGLRPGLAYPKSMVTNH